MHASKLIRPAGDEESRPAKSIVWNILPLSYVRSIFCTTAGISAKRNSLKAEILADGAQKKQKHQRRSLRLIPLREEVISAPFGCRADYTFSIVTFFSTTSLFGLFWRF
jgi:hypothetical protein